tara:strand:+ start:120 stop:533 length:414 start_codon:yes stop_codon:yes gene_type:complete
MDFNKLDTKAAMTEGHWLHLRSPKGDLLFADDKAKKKPSRILVYGIDSERAQQAVRGLSDAQRLVATSGTDDRSLQELEEQGVGFVLEIAGGIENVIVDGKEVQGDRESLRAFFLRFTWVGEQVFGVFRDRGRYLEN